MQRIDVPDLKLRESFRFCEYLNRLQWDEKTVFDFGRVRTCEPFAMLLTGMKIKQARNEHLNSQCCGVSVNNSYASTMRYYRFVGMDQGRTFDVDYGNENYLPITKIDFYQMFAEARSSHRHIGEIITENSKKMSGVLSRGDNTLEEILTYCIREMIRNIQEHSSTLEGWYCAQYWPTKSMVELALIDDGIGIASSLNSNYSYAQQFLSNKDALRKALAPGVSCKSSDEDAQEIFQAGNEWQNSGYGLYVVSQVCARLNGEFVLTSGSDAIAVSQAEDGSIVHEEYTTNIRGTAICMRIDTSKIGQIHEILHEIYAETNTEEGAFRTPSVASIIRLNS